jgi:hypothetical protein
VYGAVRDAYAAIMRRATEGGGGVESVPQAIRSSSPSSARCGRSRPRGALTGTSADVVHTIVAQSAQRYLPHPAGSLRVLREHDPGPFGFGARNQPKGGRPPRERPFANKCWRTHCV